MATKPLPPPRTGNIKPGGVIPHNGKVRTFGVTHGRQVGAQRVLIYGPGGVGKSELCSLLSKPVFLDLEHGSKHFDVPRVSGVESFDDVRAWLQSDESAPFDQVVIDTATKLEEIAKQHVIADIPHEKPGVRITSIEGFGFGKGYQHLFDEFEKFLQDCDRLVRLDKTVVLIAHDTTNEAPNPNGENWLRFEPMLQHPKKQASIRNRAFGWADHVLFIGYDVAVGDDKVGIGAGTRTIYTTELPSHMAKTRGAHDGSVHVPPAMPYDRGDDAIWTMLLGGAK